LPATFHFFRPLVGAQSSPEFTDSSTYFGRSDWVNSTNLAEKEMEKVTLLIVFDKKN